MTRNLQLDDTLTMPGCPVCRIVVQRVAQTIESIQNELVLDPAYREQVDAAWGFCNLHARQWLNQAQPLSTAIIYEAVLGRVARDLERTSPQRASRTGQFRSRLPWGTNGGRACTALVESRVCPLCQVRDAQERQLIAQLLDALCSEPFRQGYRQSDGLCVPHLNLALCAAPAADVFEVLRARLLETQEALRGQLREVIRKHDYRFREEAAGPEWTSVERAVSQVAGITGIDGRRSRTSTPEQ